MIKINKPTKRSHTGSVLLLVLVAIMMMSLATSSYLLMMKNEHRASRQSGKQLQADYLNRAGVAYLQELLSQNPNQIEQQGGLTNNPTTFQGVLVVDSQWDIDRGRFTIVAPDMEQGYYSGVLYGLENESAKINLNALVAPSSDEEESEDSPRDRLLALPGMDASIADAILDWIDDDSRARSQGAEEQHYQSLTPAYAPRNGPINSLDELLMVRGVTPELLYGLDSNRNLMVDDNEQPRGLLLQLDNSQGQLDRGWSAYLTVHSLEKGKNSNGEELIDVNAFDLRKLHNDISSKLGEEAANFIVAARQYGLTVGSGSGGGIDAPDNSSSVKIDFDTEAKEKIDSFLDLVGATVSVQAEGGPSQTLQSPWQDNPAVYRQEFSELLDYVTADGENGKRGRINIQLASRPVLLSLPNATESLVDQVLARRDTQADYLQGDQRHPIWLLTEGIVTLEEMKEIWPHITTKGDVYSGQIIGFFDEETTQIRTQVFLDRSGDQVQLVGHQDLSQLGPGFSPTDLGAQPTLQNSSSSTTP